MTEPKAEAQFTPGPWKAEPSVLLQADTCILGSDGLAVAHVIFAKDAPLIAAAPDLYEALAAAHEYILKLETSVRDRVYASEELGKADAWHDVDAFAYDGTAAAMRDEIGAALAKARGES